MHSESAKKVLLTAYGVISEMKYNAFLIREKRIMLFSIFRFPEILKFCFPVLSASRKVDKHNKPKPFFPMMSSLFVLNFIKTTNFVLEVEATESAKISRHKKFARDGTRARLACCVTPTPAPGGKTSLCLS